MINLPKSFPQQIFFITKIKTFLSVWIISRPRWSVLIHRINVGIRSSLVQIGFIVNPLLNVFKYYNRLDDMLVIFDHLRTDKDDELVQHLIEVH